ncbi:hypothetical protein B566_EDAN016426 [Ephemera danica]|nr:hypothetical protein B566_EDAN016426 [Ephemera danica]
MLYMMSCQDWLYRARPDIGSLYRVSHQSCTEPNGHMFSSHETIFGNLLACGQGAYSIEIQSSALYRLDDQFLQK